MASDIATNSLNQIEMDQMEPMATIAMNKLVTTIKASLCTSNSGGIRGGCCTIALLQSVPLHMNSHCAHSVLSEIRNHTKTQSLININTTKSPPQS